MARIINLSDKHITGFTLVDITPTGMTRDPGVNSLSRNQQRNWETVIQCIGLRAQPMNLQCFSPDNRMELEDLKDWEFGEMYTGRHKIWAFSFMVEHSNVFAQGNDPLKLLDDSFDEVPVTTYLTETAKFILPVFYTSGAIKNIYFKIGSLKLNS
jgi:hypothetical protein